MALKTTLRAREEELRSMLATPAGREKLHLLAAGYFAASGNLMPASASPITYILVHERERGLIIG
jgi:hypothetical protein